MGRLTRAVSAVVDYTGPATAGLALWAFTVTGWPVLLRFFRTTGADYEPERIG